MNYKTDSLTQNKYLETTLHLEEPNIYLARLYFKCYEGCYNKNPLIFMLTLVTLHGKNSVLDPDEKFFLYTDGLKHSIDITSVETTNRVNGYKYNRTHSHTKAKIILFKLQSDLINKIIQSKNVFFEIRKFQKEFTRIQISEENLNTLKKSINVCSQPFKSS